jgi:hypothetical protein
MGEPRSRAWLIDRVLAYLDASQQRRFATEASAPLGVLVATAKRDRPDWVPMSTFTEAIVLADRVAGNGDLSACWKLGRFVATHEVGAVQALAMRVLRPSLIMSIAPGLWSTHFQDAGRVTIRATGDRALIVSFPDSPTPERAHCLAVGGWIEGWLGLGPRKSIRVDHPICRCTGHASCDYTVAWEE